MLIVRIFNLLTSAGFFIPVHPLEAPTEDRFNGRVKKNVKDEDYGRGEWWSGVGGGGSRKEPKGRRQGRKGGFLGVGLVGYSVGGGRWCGLMEVGEFGLPM